MFLLASRTYSRSNGIEDWVSSTCFMDTRAMKPSSIYISSYFAILVKHPWFLSLSVISNQKPVTHFICPTFILTSILFLCFNLFFYRRKVLCQFLQLLASFSVNAFKVATTMPGLVIQLNSIDLARWVHHYPSTLRLVLVLSSFSKLLYKAL